MKQNGVYRLYSSVAPTDGSNKCAKIDLDALRGNYRVLRAHLRSGGSAADPIAVVKADAYGHGAPACVHALLSEGCRTFAVSCIEEALAVRRFCDRAGQDATILILGYTDPAAAPLLATHRLTQLLVSLPYALQLNDAALLAGVRLRVHVALNTGMHRIGIDAVDEESCADAVVRIERILSLRALESVGMCTHFARADGDTPEDLAATDRQSTCYRAVREGLLQKGICIPFHHVCNSAAGLARAADRFDGVRLGIALYGAADRIGEALPLSPVMHLQTRVVHLHTVPAGDRIGYGGRFLAESPRRIATLPLGYGDGFLRAYRGAILTVHTAAGACSAPVVGNVCMDQCMIDVTEGEVSLGDAVSIFGHTRGALPALAKHAGTIPYEALCLLSARVPRIYFENGKRVDPKEWEGEEI